MILYCFLTAAKPQRICCLEGIAVMVHCTGRNLPVQAQTHMMQDVCSLRNKKTRRKARLLCYKFTIISCWSKTAQQFEPFDIQPNDGHEQTNAPYHSIYFAVHARLSTYRNRGIRFNAAMATTKREIPIPSAFESYTNGISMPKHAQHHRDKVKKLPMPTVAEMITF